MKKLLLLAVATATLPALRADLIAYWNLNEPSGAVADTSGSGSAMNFGATSGTAANLAYGVASITDGTYGAITVSNAAGFGTAMSSTGGASIYDSANVADKVDSLANNFTTMLWFNAASLTATQRLLSGPLGSGTAAWGVGLSGANFVFTKGGVADIFTSNTTNLTTGTWHNLAVTVSSTTGTSFYLDGNLLQTVANTGNIVTTKVAGFGLFGSASSTGESFAGKLDDVRIYNTVLDVNQIRTAAATAVPEPATYGLAGAGALTVALLRRRRSR